ncbi:hypothetical protein N7495_009160 [Penicillium taxi]|uniref:uncharacterized protein n=1 Tax=Penicillium taxi TaxID=168475 RepID=UPI0025452822|nr:uncharacterized protein N7495_009160 [Penicillium taxi]KAJ5884650.1 hypothetical protein N7495_009160 [Penicillium taxi]
MRFDDISHGHGHETKFMDRNDEKLFPAPPFDGDMVGEMSVAEQNVYDHGIKQANRLGWKRLTIVLIVEAIALGSLSIPSTFAKLGMVAGVISSVGIGLIAIYTSYIVGQVKVMFPEVANYADAGRLMWGRFGYELINAMLALQLIFLTGSHCLTGTIAWMNITKSDICSVIFSVVSSIILFFLAIPPFFSEQAILGFIDFASIIIAIGITIIGTGVQAHNSTGGLSAVDWSAWPQPDITFTDAFIAMSNIVFAYSFAMAQFTFMDEMHTPRDFPKSVWVLGLTEIFIYTITGALIYAFVGQDVQSPALTSAGDLLGRISYGVALPVIFISGSINTVVFGRLVHGRIFANSNIRFINTKMGWITWISVVLAATIIAFVIAEVIPFFDDLLSISSALFISGFTFYFPACMWFLLLREGKWTDRKNIILAIVNGFIFLIGMLILGAGTYASVDDIVLKYQKGTVRGVFTCAAPK